MPNEWGIGDNREIHETFSHELGHNLGLGDQYTPAVAGRNPGGWELMHADDPFPHFSHRPPDDARLGAGRAGSAPSTSPRAAPRWTQT